MVHDAHNPDPSVAFAISRLTDSGYLNRSPIGIFRQVERSSYDEEARKQLSAAAAGRARHAARAPGRTHRQRRHLDRRLTRSTRASGLCRCPAAERSPAKRTETMGVLRVVVSGAIVR